MATEEAITLRTVVVLGALVALVVLPTVNAWPPDIEDAYEVLAANPRWGGGYGYMWGHPTQGAILWLDLTSGGGYFAFTIGGAQSLRETPAGTLVLDRWVGPDPADRFVGGYFREDGEDPVLAHGVDDVGFGEGMLNGWAITVTGHT